MKEKKRGRSVVWVVCSIVFTVLFAVSVIGGAVANNYATLINMFLGIEGSKTVGEPGKIYYAPDYATSEQQVAAARTICEDIVTNGAVLLKNENNALPMQKGAKLTLIGNTAANFIYGSAGSSSMDVSSASTLKTALEGDGFEINPVMWDFYTKGKGSEYGQIKAGGSLNNYIFKNEEFFVNEVPLSAFTSAEWDSVKNYGDAAIMVFGRVCGEGPDIPAYGAGDGDGNWLSLSKEERDILGKLAELKAQGVLSRIIVLLAGSNAMELDFLKPELCGADYGVDACMWIGATGVNGIHGIGDLLNGTVNPSGKLVDTFCYDNLTSPAIQNAYVTSYSNASAQGLSFKGSCNEYYVVYQEGIYVGYRYYETRYEDMVLGNAKVGAYDYASTVAYPFGYGLSYTTYSYGPLSMTDGGSTLTFTVDVTNTGSQDGKEVVELYMQSPYTDYDRENGVEKASVELVGFTKVAVPAGQTVSATVTVNKSELRAYDANGAKTYIVDAGNYYFACGNGAHEALNNILAAKAQLGDTSNGTVDTGRMTGSGDPALVCQYVQASLDKTTYAVAATGMAITNQLDHADLNKFDSDASNDVVYLSRSDWAGTMPKGVITAKEYKAAVQLAANDAIAKGLAAYTYTPGGSSAMPTMGKAGNLKLVQYVGVPLDGSITVDGATYTWDDLLDQVSFLEMSKLVGVGYHGTAVVPSVGKPSTTDENGPQGITATLTGGGSSTSYTSEDLMAASFDPEIARTMGRSLGNDCLLANGKVYSGLYGPGANIHRTPYSGRNAEYYSEDPFISGKICAAETAGIQSKGVYVYLKHFALNDQETGRDGISVWTNEQAAREIYLQAFEYPIVEEGAYCVMTSFNRMGCVWAGGDYNLMTNILRGEWAMPGFIVTDFSNYNNYMDVLQGVLAGGDTWDCNDASKWTDKLKQYANDANVVNAMRDATRRILYTVVNSNAMNNIGIDSEIVEVHPWWKTAFVAMDVVFGVLAAGSIAMLVMSRRKGKKDNG